ncbi:hypothetical protein BJX63DRAFT_429858 [Aspergillus granulosus]|uniref:Uncharacterized protein n=1 Tax=Aspergillus granulosus TaxID=176169 RepID=A0ABR4HPQ3_9EURO
MKFTTSILVCASSLLMTAQAGSILVCYESNFEDCVDVVAPHGQCVYLPSRFNDHVYSARATTGHHCDSYDIACAPGSMITQGIDREGYRGLPDGHRVSGFMSALAHPKVILIGFRLCLLYSLLFWLMGL